MKPGLKKSLKVLVILLIPGVWIIENSRGQPAWNKAKERAVAAGVSLDITDYQPAEISDDKNLLKNEHFYNEWVGNVEPLLNSWSKMNLPGTRPNIARQGAYPNTESTVSFAKFFDESLSEEEAVAKLSAASAELGVRLNELSAIILSYPVHPLFNNLPTEENSTPPAPEFSSPLKITRCFQDLAILDLRTHRPQKAIERIQVIKRLAELCDGPTLSQHIVSNSLRSVKHTIIWEGLRLQSWDKSQLKELLNLTSQSESLEAIERLLKCEIAYLEFGFDHREVLSDLLKLHTFSNQEDSKKPTFGKLQRYYYTDGPRGWTQQRKAIVLHQFLDHLEHKDHWNAQYLEDIDSSQEVGMWNPFFLAYTADNYWLPPILKNELQFITEQRVARLAIHLELHFLKHGHYPKSLNELQGQPLFPDATDPKERPLAFDLDSQGRPQIWSEHEAAQSHRNQRFRWQYHEKESTAPRRRKSSTRSTPSINVGP